MTTTDTDYEWHEGWAKLPDDPSLSRGWAHHGMGVLSDGVVVAFHPAESTLLFFEGDGRLARSVAVEASEAHGLTVVVEDGEDRLWIADPGVKVHRQQHDDGDGDGDPAKQFTVSGAGARVIKLDLDGNVLQRIERAPRPEYESGGYAPTWVAVDEVRHGGSGDIWVADGYGQSLVHRYRADGTYVSTLTGEDGAGRFSCPHAVFLDRRGEEPALLVADRGNARVQEYGLDGAYRRVLGEGVLNSPSALATKGDLLVVAELNARVAILDRDGGLVSYEGENGEVTSRPGWPNALDEKGNVIPPTTEAGRFNSPHGLTVDADGKIYVAEWLLGGRHVRLAPKVD
jgi:sugar lactone lactonase YvrE